MVKNFIWLLGLLCLLCSAVSVRADSVCINCNSGANALQSLVPNLSAAAPSATFAPRSYAITGAPRYCNTSATYCLEADSTTRRLSLYQNGQGVKAWDIIMLPPGRVMRGFIDEIIYHPTWCPTASLRARYPGLPAGCLPPGHPQNAMGDVKITLSGDFAGTAIRIHDTRGFGREWTNEDSSGCVRVLNLETEVIPLIGGGRGGAVEVVFF